MDIQNAKQLLEEAKRATAFRRVSVKGADLKVLCEFYIKHQIKIGVGPLAQALLGETPLPETQISNSAGKEPA